MRFFNNFNLHISHYPRTTTGPPGDSRDSGEGINVIIAPANARPHDATRTPTFYWLLHHVLWLTESLTWLTSPNHDTCSYDGIHTSYCTPIAYATKSERSFSNYVWILWKWMFLCSNVEDWGEKSVVVSQMLKCCQCQCQWIVEVLSIVSVSVNWSVVFDRNVLSSHDIHDGKLDYWLWHKSNYTVWFGHHFLLLDNLLNKWLLVECISWKAMSLPLNSIA